MLHVWIINQVAALQQLHYKKTKLINIFLCFRYCLEMGKHKRDTVLAHYVVAGSICPWEHTRRVTYVEPSLLSVYVTRICSDYTFQEVELWPKEHRLQIDLARKALENGMFGLGMMIFNSAVNSRSNTDPSFAKRREEDPNYYPLFK